jgi:hypothetical protein
VLLQPLQQGFGSDEADKLMDLGFYKQPETDFAQARGL